MQLGIHHFVLGIVVLTALAAPSTSQCIGAEPKAEKPPLPLSELILYSSGVGYFQRDGQVEGKVPAELQFKIDDTNDLLKSMVVQDPAESGGGVERKLL